MIAVNILKKDVTQRPCGVNVELILSQLRVDSFAIKACLLKR